MGTLSLALRSLADANAPETSSDNQKRDSIDVVRYGVSTPTTVQR
jgi:pilus assembly protein CpaB